MFWNFNCVYIFEFAHCLQCEENKNKSMEFELYNDCLQLIERFVQHGDATFKAFCNQWKNMHFQHIYTLQTTNTEIMNTTDAVFHVAKRTVCARNVNGELLYTPAEEELHAALLRRIAGLYLIYAIYFKQPTRQFIKVCVSLKTWQEMQHFLNILPQNFAARHEVLFIFWRLVETNAFRFTACDYSSGLENLVKYDMIKENHSNDSGSLLKQELTGIKVLDKMLPGLGKLEDHYNATKKALVAKGAEGLTAKALPSTTIFRELQNAFGRVQHILAESPTKQATSSKQRKRDVKSEAMKEKVMLKSTPTVFKDQLPMDILNDLDGNISEDSETSNSTDNNADCIASTSFRGLEMLLDEHDEEIVQNTTTRASAESQNKEPLNVVANREIEQQLHKFLSDD